MTSDSYKSRRLFIQVAYHLSLKIISLISQIDPIFRKYPTCFSDRVYQPEGPQSAVGSPLLPYITYTKPR